MKPIIDALPRELIEAEMKGEYFLRDTNNAANQIYVITAAKCPNIMREIGRLREWAFREAGGGTGEEVDIDELDLEDEGYRQLFVWDPSAREIVGGYRYVVSHSSDTKFLSTEHYFRFSNKFRRQILPYTIELGRSFVHPLYQSTKLNSKSLYAMDNLWDGLGALMIQYPRSRYFFGKVTMYGHYNVEARNILLFFLHKYFPDRDNLLESLYPIELNIDEQAMAAIFTGGNYADDYRILVHEVRERGETIPPMINSYMNLSPSMRVFGTVCNPDFGNVQETAILITIKDMYPRKTERHTRGLESLLEKINKIKILRPQKKQS